MSRFKILAKVADKETLTEVKGIISDGKNSTIDDSLDLCAILRMSINSSLTLSKKNLVLGDNKNGANVSDIEVIDIETSHPFKIKLSWGDNGTVESIQIENAIVEYMVDSSEKIKEDQTRKVDSIVVILNKDFGATLKHSGEVHEFDKGTENPGVLANSKNKNMMAFYFSDVESLETPSSFLKINRLKHNQDMLREELQSIVINNIKDTLSSSIGKAINKKLSESIDELKKIKNQLEFNLELKEQELDRCRKYYQEQVGEARKDATVLRVELEQYKNRGFWSRLFR